MENTTEIGKILRVLPGSDIIILPKLYPSVPGHLLHNVWAFAEAVLAAHCTMNNTTGYSPIPLTLASLLQLYHFPYQGRKRTGSFPRLGDISERCRFTSDIITSWPWIVILGKTQHIIMIRWSDIVRQYCRYTGNSGWLMEFSNNQRTPFWLLNAFIC